MEVAGGERLFFFRFFSTMCKQFFFIYSLRARAPLRALGRGLYQKKG